MDYKLKIKTFLHEKLKLDMAYLEENLEVPPRDDMGDYALPCFRLAKELRKSPQVIASDFVNQLTTLPAFIAKVEAQGPYVNVFLDNGVICEEFIAEVLQTKQEYLSSNEGEGKTICIDFSAPNIAKPFHVGHGFSTFLGDAIARMYEHQGYEVERINHLGDYGTQFGKLIVAYERWVDEEALENTPIAELLRIYVKYHEVSKNEPSIDDEARLRFKRLEDGEAHELALWERFRDLSLNEFNRLYALLDVRFDSYRGESYYTDLIPSLVKDLDDKGILVDSQGAKVVMLDEENLPPCIILKSDGSSIYATRDLATAKFRHDTYNFYKNIYVVGLPQSLHFQQVFSVLKKAGYAWADDCTHVGFGLVKFPSNVLFSTRSGDVVYLEDLLNEAVSKTKDIILQNNEKRDDKMSTEEVNETAQSIGLAAIRYMYIKSNREKDIIFRWEDILDFEGDSAPYMQYAYARAKSIMRKSAYSEEEIAQFSASSLGSESEFQLVKLLNHLQDALVYASEAYEPSIFARHIQSTCRAFNKFYKQMPILNAANKEEKESRLLLCYVFQKLIRESLQLLGIQTVERM